MRWSKRGLIYRPRGNLAWARTHSHLPTAEVIEDRCIRVYFDSLDEDKFGRIGYVDLDIEEPKRVIYVAEDPILDIGARGTFDDSGVNPSCVVQVEHEKFLYYIGWQRAERVPYMLFAGLAISQDGGRSFEKYSRVPVLDRTEEEPFSRGAPFVHFEDGTFKMWYWSCTGWSVDNGVVRYNNVIRHAVSHDGVRWMSDDRICIMCHGEEYSVGRPWVIKEGQIYRMWYSIRSRVKPYHSIGYAESCDGITWARKDGEVGIGPSRVGWDSEMVCFPCVVDARGRTFLFYNGNGNGATGFGYAELERE